MIESTFKKNLNNTYGKTVHSKKSFLCYLVMRLEKDMSKKATQLMKLWIQDTQLELILLKAVYVCQRYFFKSSNQVLLKNKESDFSAIAAWLLQVAMLCIFLSCCLTIVYQERKKDKAWNVTVLNIVVKSH